MLLPSLAGFSQDNPLPVTKPDTLSNEGVSAKATHPSETNNVPGEMNPIYTLKPAVDIPIITAGTAFSLYAFTQIYDKPASTEEEVTGLHTSDINAFDRWSIHPYTSDLHDLSDAVFYTSIPL